MVAIDVDKAEQVAALVKEIRPTRDSYTDPRIYPPLSDTREDQLAFFTAMVAVDHRTSTPWSSFEGYIQGEFYHGADALYRLGRLAYDEGFFKAERLASLTPKEAERLFRLGDAVVWDFYTRVYLLRDLGKKALLRGGFEALVSTSSIGELKKRLAEIRAYEDPVAKKTMLLAKFLDGRKLADFKDVEEADVPVDNHLSRIAYRLGIVDIDYDFLESGIELTREDDIKLREVVKTAWRIVAKLADVHPFALDDFLWNFGRKTCLRVQPRCDSCPLRDVCKAHAVSRYPPEHLHLATWYY